MLGNCSLSDNTRSFFDRKGELSLTRTVKIKGVEFYTGFPAVSTSW